MGIFLFEFDYNFFIVISDMAMYSEKYWAWHHNVEDAGIEVVSFGF